MCWFGHVETLLVVVFKGLQSALKKSNTEKTKQKCHLETPEEKMHAFGRYFEPSLKEKPDQKNKTNIIEKNFDLRRTRSDFDRLSSHPCCSQLDNKSFVLLFRNFQLLEVNRFFPILSVG